MGKGLRIILSPRIHVEKATYDDLHLTSLFQVPEPETIHGVELEIFPSPRASMYGGEQYITNHTSLRLGVLRPFWCQSHVFIWFT